jgi:hypothetical protein
MTNNDNNNNNHSAVIGEIDEDKDLGINFDTVRADPIKPVVHTAF